MDFKDEIKLLGSRPENLKNQVQPNEVTKKALIMPFIKAFGYEAPNLYEAVPELVAYLGINQSENVDYAIFKDQQPILLIECKSHRAKLDVHNSSPFRYLRTTKAKFGTFTKNIRYKFNRTPNYSD